MRLPIITLDGNLTPPHFSSSLKKNHPASNFLVLRPCVCTTWERTPKSNNRDDNYLQLNLSNKSKLNNNQCFLTLTYTRQHPAGRVARSATLLSKLLRPDCFTVHKLFSSQTAAGRLVESPGNVRPLLSFGIPHLKPAAGRLVESPNLRTPPKLAAGRLVEPPGYLRPLLSIWDPAAGRLVPRLFENPSSAPP